MKLPNFVKTHKKLTWAILAIVVILLISAGQFCLEQLGLSAAKKAMPDIGKIYDAEANHFRTYQILVTKGESSVRTTETQQDTKYYRVTLSSRYQTPSETDRETAARLACSTAPDPAYTIYVTVRRQYLVLPLYTSDTHAFTCQQ